MIIAANSAPAPTLWTPALVFKAFIRAVTGEAGIAIPMAESAVHRFQHSLRRNEGPRSLGLAFSTNSSFATTRCWDPRSRRGAGRFGNVISKNFRDGRLQADETSRAFAPLLDGTGSGRGTRYFHGPRHGWFCFRGSAISVPPRLAQFGNKSGTGHTDCLGGGLGPTQTFQKKKKKPRGGFCPLFRKGRRAIFGPFTDALT